MTIRKIIFIFALLIFYLAILGPIVPVKASEELFTSYEVVYEATNKGSLLVSQSVSLTNKLSSAYATQYSFSLEGIQPQNIKAFDQQGPLVVISETQNETTTLHLRFNQEIVGKDKTLQFTLTYEAPQLIQQSGKVWEITIPKLASANEIDNYNLTLKVPLEFGKPAYISPDPQSQKIDGGSQLFFFDKNQITNAGVITAFGEFQVFDFSLTYHLTNPTLETVMAKVALPPDTNYQKISYHKISPGPENIEADRDGNWLGTYKLKPKEKVVVTAQGQAKILAYPQTKQFQFTGEEELVKYLQPQKYWETENSEIQAIAKKLKTPKAIYDYVVRTLDYDYSRVRKGAERLGAQEALGSPQRAICMEYTDLFIALARAAGIPAREINGFAYTSNPSLQPLSLVQDVLHAWPEYWDSQRKIWIQVDPTWQDTTGGVDYFSKLDLGHFVFAIHGLNSQFPPPAGSYKEEKSTQKDVQISFGQYQEPNRPLLKADFLLPSKIVTETTNEGKIRIFNTGSEAIYNLQMEIVAEGLKLLSPNYSSLAILPPFSSHEIPISLVAEKTFSSGAGKIIARGNNQQFEYNLIYQSVVLRRILPILGVLIIILLLILLSRRWGFRFLKKV